MKRSLPTITIYSPARMEDWEYQGGGENFSSIANGMYVVEAVGFDWSPHQAMLLSCIKTTAKMGFAKVAPWYPGAKKLHAALLALLTDIETDGHNVFGYFEPSADALRELFDLWQRPGAWLSGEWQIGGCSSRFAGNMLEPRHSYLSRFLSQSTNVGCLLSLDELQDSTLLVRSFDGIGDWLEDLRKTYDKNDEKKGQARSGPLARLLKWL